MNKAENDMEKTLKQVLAEQGYTCERVMRSGEFRGMRILKNGAQVHESIVASAGFGWDLVSGVAA